MCEDHNNVNHSRVYRWDTCWCPVCGRRHRDLVYADARRRGGPHQQACDHCFLRGAPEEAKERYQRYKYSLAPPDDGEPEVRRPVQLQLAFVQERLTTTTVP